MTARARAIASGTVRLASSASQAVRSSAVSRAISWPARARSGGESPCQTCSTCALIVAAASSCVRGALAAGVAGVAAGAAPGGDSRPGAAPAGAGPDGVGGEGAACDAAAVPPGQFAGADGVGPLDAAGALGA